MGLGFGLGGNRAWLFGEFFRMSVSGCIKIVIGKLSICVVFEGLLRFHMSLGWWVDWKHMGSLPDNANCMLLPTLVLMICILDKDNIITSS